VKAWQNFHFVSAVYLQGMRKKKLDPSLKKNRVTIAGNPVLLLTHKIQYEGTATQLRGKIICKVLGFVRK
jgi:hypothetical protein